MKTRKTVQRQLAAASFLVVVLLASAFVFYFTEGMGPTQVLVLIGIAGFAMANIIFCLHSLVDKVYPKNESE